MHRQHTLPNGAAVLAELDPEAHSAAVGFFVRCGSRDEPPELAGVSHFLEHMAFKGDERYSAEDVNRVFDEIGAKYNAYTSHEQTVYYAAVLPEHLPLAVDLLSTLTRPVLREDEFDLEKKVILEEIGMHDDQPGSVAYDALSSAHFQKHPLAGRILGTNESVGGLTIEAMRAYHAEKYVGANLTLAVCGNADWDEVVRLAEEHAGRAPAGEARRDTPAAAPPGETRVVHKPEQAQQTVMLAGPAPDNRSPLRHAADVLAAVVGDDVGSRLFWELVDPGRCEACGPRLHRLRRRRVVPDVPLLRRRPHGRERRRRAGRVRRRQRPRRHGRGTAAGEEQDRQPAGAAERTPDGPARQPRRELAGPGRI